MTLHPGPQVLAEATGIPVPRLSSASGAEALTQLEQDLLAEVLGQEEAVAGAARVMRLWRAGLLDPSGSDRPAATLALVGPPGVGKRTLCKVGHASTSCKLHEHCSCSIRGRVLHALCLLHAGPLPPCVP